MSGQRGSGAETTMLAVFLYYPNLIGYLRVILAVWAFAVIHTEPVLCATLYGASCLLDVFDGWAARYFKQCMPYMGTGIYIARDSYADVTLIGTSTRFGAVLDMVTDRSTTTCLLCFLALRFPAWTWAFQALIALDLSSHYMHMVASLVRGAESHKSVAGSGHSGPVAWLLRLYYHNRSVLFTLCAANELFWMALYLRSYNINGPTLFTTSSGRAWTVVMLVLHVSGPLCAWKHVMNAVQLTLAAVELADGDAKRVDGHGSPAVKRAAATGEVKRASRSPIKRASGSTVSTSPATRRASPRRGVQGKSE